VLGRFLATPRLPEKGQSNAIDVLSRRVRLFPRQAFSMRLLFSVWLVLTFSGFAVGTAESPVKTPRPVPATRPEMKQLLEEMKKRPYRIPLPELTEKDREQLGERTSSYEARLRFHYVPAAEGTVFGGVRSQATDRPSSNGGSGTAPRYDFTRNADANMTLTYQFKTMLFWIVSRTNNCQYCLGHQEWKLSATGLGDDAIAALDVDWSRYTKKEQAAFAYARLLTYTPHQLSELEIVRIGQYYQPAPILEMTMSISGNNAINRWKEGIGIPQSQGNTFTSRGRAAEAEVKHSDSFTTPTSNLFATRLSLVAPL
jgi:hypothetical protein